MARILIVEDESIEAMNLKECLHSMDHEVIHVASRGEEAVQKTIELEPDLILMDIVLKGDMDGIDAAKSIKSLNIPLLYLTAYSDENTLKKALAGEPYGYILKPFDERKMKMAIEVALYKNKTETKFKKQQETYYQTIFENSGTAMGIIEENMQLSRVNMEFVALTGFSKETIENHMKWTDFFSEKNQLKLKKFHLNRMMDPFSTPEHFESQLITNDKNIKPVLLNFALIPGTKKSTISILNISKLREAEDILKKSQKKYKGIFDNAAEAIILLDRKGTILEVNSKLIELSGFSKDELIGTNFVKLLSHVEISCRKALNSFKRLIGGGNLKDIEWNIKNKNGEEVHILAHPSILKEKNKINSIMVILEDITQRKIAENKLKNSLTEKEILLREIHHRVKNNMQIISSILSLQSMQLNDKAMKDILIECQGRVKSMALIHEKLYQSPDMGHISFDIYLKKLLSEIYNTYTSHTSSIKLNMDIDNIELSIESAMPCGLIINELVSNSLKHAFPKDKGILTIALQTDEYNKDYYILTVQDDGIGLPKNIDPEKTSKLGLKVVSILVDQLNGKLELDRSHGTKFTLKFRDLEYERRL